jgi:hypothetical protein
MIQMCLWKEGHIYVYILLLFTELIALPANANYVKCYDFEGLNNSSGQSASLDLRHLCNGHYICIFSTLLSPPPSLVQISSPAPCYQTSPVYVLPCY